MYFTFQTSTLLPNGSVVLLTLPPEFSLNTSNPVPGVDAPMFSDASASLPLIISVGLTTVTFTNVAAVPQLSTFSITISGVQMPRISPLPNSTNNFSLKVTKNGKPVTSISNFDTLYYSSAFTADSMAALLVVGKPVTGLACLYTFRLEPVHSIPKSGIIQILFPFNATFLSCGVIGAITEFSSCSVGSDNRMITITLTESYYTGVFNITLQEVVNPTTAGSYSFVVNSLYDGVMMDSVTVTTRLYTIADSVGVSIAAVPTS